MAAVDASIGIKTAVNFEMGGVVKKNKLGTYSPPLAVFIDKAFLATLDRRHLSNGAAEVRAAIQLLPFRAASCLCMHVCMCCGAVFLVSAARYGLRTC